jgi:hypothetical protein
VRPPESRFCSTGMTSGMYPGGAITRISRMVAETMSASIA